MFDASYLPQLIDGEWPSKEAKALFVLFTGTLSVPLTSYSVDRLHRLSEADYEKKLLPVLSLKEVPDRLSLIDRAKETLRPMLELDEAQLEYVERLMAGDYHPQLLLPFNPDLAERLKRHPALQWKAKHAKEHRGTKIPKK